jgi:CHAT domain-containing protein/predicted negative regulator of RcsB-dependent stress response
LVSLALAISACRKPHLPPDREWAEVRQIFQSGHLAEAQSRAEHARLALNNTQSEWAAHFRVEEARVRLFQGENAKAIALLKDERGHASVDRSLAIDRLIILSLAEARTGETAQSNDSMVAATTLCNCDTDSPNTKMRGDILSAKGSLALQKNDFSTAQTYFLKSLETAHADNDRYLEARMRLNLGFIKLQQHHYEDALEQSQAASDIAHGIGAELIVVGAQGNAGWAYYAIGDYQRALVNFNDAAASAASLGSTIDQENWDNVAGMTEARIGNLDAAQKHYESALTLARSMKSALEISHVEQPLASLLLHRRQPNDARPYIDEAKRLAQQTGDASDIQFGNLLEAQFLAQSDNVPNAITLLLDVEQKTKSFPTIRLEAQHTLAQVYDKVGDRNQAETWFQLSIATYRSERSELQTDDARLPFSQNGRDVYMDYVTYLIRNHRTDAALDVIDQGRAETLAEGLGLEHKHAPAPAQRTPLKALARQAHAVILVYSMSQKVSYLWASNGKESGFYLLPNRDAILTAVASHRRALLAARDLVAEQHPAARDLYEMLVKPAEHLIHHGDRVFIVAGGLNGLNFETLLTPGQSGHYWIEDVTITHLASLRLFALTHRQLTARDADPHQNQLLVIGNPIYASQQYTPLPNAAAEVADVAAHFPANARTVLTGVHASPDAYVHSDPARFTYIHFVSHATASRLVPLDSAVILSSQGTPESGKLYARDILSKPLHAELVTISACQGSGVREYAGEGLVGLAWAFLRAGSHNVIGALWDVSDASTPELMQHLYNGIAAGNPPDVSLRAAKLDMLHSRGVFRKPIYWGAFQLYSSGQ